MIDPKRILEMRSKLLEHLEAALAITDDLKAGTAGYLVERALDQIRVEDWPGNLDVPLK